MLTNWRILPNQLNKWHTGASRGHTEHICYGSQRTTDMDDYNEIQLQNLMGTDDQDLESLMAEEFPQIVVEEELPMDLLNEY